MNEITIKIQDLNHDSAELSNLDDKAVQSIVGSGLLGGFASASAAVIGVTIDGWRNGRSSAVIMQQQIDYGVPAFAFGFLLPEP